MCSIADVMTVPAGGALGQTLDGQVVRSVALAVNTTPAGAAPNRRATWPGPVQRRAGFEPERVLGVGLRCRFQKRPHHATTRGSTGEKPA